MPRPSRVNWIKLKHRIPHSVSLGSKATWEVLFVDRFIDGNLLGETRFPSDGRNIRQIILKRDLTPRELVLTYLHELLHALAYEADIQLTENQVQALETKFLYLLKPGNVFKGETP